MLGLGININKYCGSDSSIYPLDVISGATIAFSFRNLTASWKGNAVTRLRRASDNLEQDFLSSEITTSNLLSFYDSSNVHVVKMYDQVGSYDYAQTTASKQPVLFTSGGVLNTINSKPAMYFDAGNNNVLINTSTTETILTSTGTFSTIHSYISGTIWGTRTNSSNNRQFNLALTGLTLVNQAGVVKYILQSVTPTPSTTNSLILFADGSTPLKSMTDGADYAVGGGITKDWMAESMLSTDSLQFGTKSDGSGAERGYGTFYLSEFIYWNTDKYSSRTDLYNTIGPYYTI